jgi:hypothetical protein
MENTTYILIGRTNPYQAQRKGWGRHTLIAANYYTLTPEQASNLLMSYCCAESDNHVYSDDGAAVLSCDEVIFSKGDMAYSDDGISWWMVAAQDLDHAEAKAALRYGLPTYMAEEIYAKHEDLRPEPAVED